jgi:AraC-like DNA-binding protein
LCCTIAFVSQLFWRYGEKRNWKNSAGIYSVESYGHRKEKIMDVNRSVSEIAYELGFKYPQHFTRAFKKSTGYTPQGYRTQNQG